MTEQPRSSKASRSRDSVEHSLASPFGPYPGRLSIASGIFRDGLRATTKSADRANAAARLIAFAAALDGPLIITPGAFEVVIPACFANQNLARRFAFVGAETPTQAWRLSRFMAATASQPTSKPVPDFANINDDDVFGQAPNPSWIGVA